MSKINWMFGAVLVLGIALGVIGSRFVSAQNPLAQGTILQRTDLVAAKGMEAILVLREVPPGGESGKHTQTGNEICYIEKGSVTLEVQGKPPVTVNAGGAFQTVKGEVHNVKNASATEPVRAIVFYVARKGAKLEDLSVPAKP